MANSKKHRSFAWNKFLKIFGTSTLAVAMALTLTGCGTAPAATAPNSLVIWGFVDEDVFNPIIKDFSAQNKDIDIKYVKKTLTSGYENDSLNSILSGQGPDVWAIPNDWVYRHKDKLAAAPNALLDNAKIKPTEYFIPSVVSDSIFDKQVYAMPPTTDVLQIYYNPRIFEQAQERAKNSAGDDEAKLEKISTIFKNTPTTWEDFDALIPYLTVRNGANIQIAGAAIGTSNNISYPADIFSLLMLQNQTKIISDDLSQSTLNLPIKNTTNADVYAGKNALDFYTKYSNPTSPQYTWNSSMPIDIEAFAQGKVGIIFSYTNLTNYFAQIYPNFDYERSLVPQVGNLNPMVDYSRYTSYVVPQNSTLPDTAWNFILNLSTESASTYQSSTKELSTKKPEENPTPVLKDRGVGEPPSENIVNSIITWNKGRYPVDVDLQFKDAITRVNNHSQSSQASLDTAAANITSLLRKSTW
ncbi:MAG: hypothetical protein WCG99_01560 [Candidatus Berkelbacteria bacterium]